MSLLPPNCIGGAAVALERDQAPRQPGVDVAAAGDGLAAQGALHRRPRAWRNQAAPGWQARTRMKLWAP